MNFERFQFTTKVCAPDSKMDFPVILEDNSVLSLNNSFFKAAKLIKDKRRNGEPVDKEVQWIQEKLLSENPKICSNAIVLVCNCGLDNEVALNVLITALPRVHDNCYDIISDGIIELALKEPRKCNNTDDSNAVLLLLGDNSIHKMQYLSRKIVRLLKSNTG